MARSCRFVNLGGGLSIVDFNLQILVEALQQVDRRWGKNTLEAASSSLDLPDLPEFKIHVFESVSSTNTVVWDLLQQGTGAGTVAIALTQHAGRGQWGRQWSSPPGGLYLSLALAPRLALEHAAQLTLSSAWGIATALRCASVPVQIKWLNDLVVQGRKLGGILTETRVSQGYIQQAVVGVGINWSNPVPEYGINLKHVLNRSGSDLSNPGDLSSTGDQVTYSINSHSIDSLEILAATVLQGLRMGYSCWQHHDAPSLASAYETLLVNLGESIEVDRQPGTICGITPTGQLRVRLHPPNTAEIHLDPGTLSLGYRPKPQ